MKILVAGESWIKQTTHIKGFDKFTHSEYGEGIEWFRNAMKTSGIDMTFLPNHYASDQFPTTLEELQLYDLVLLSDIGKNTLLLSMDTFNRSVVRPNRLNLIRDYVKNGGSFAMIGGYMSFQGIDCKGGYKNTAIEEILPVELYPTDDRSENPEGAHIVITQPNHPLLRGITGEWPHFLGYNKLKAKNDATVIAEHDGHVFIATGTYGKGRTLAFASDFAPHWGPKEFVEWEHYNTFWVNAVNWLGSDKK